MIAELLVMASTVWYIPGWMKTQSARPDVMGGVTNVFPEASVAFKAWDGDRLVWPMAVKSADAEAGRILEEVAALDAGVRTNLTLVGHSLGGRIVARVLTGLAKRSLKVRQGVLMGAAIPYDDPDLGPMGGGSELPVLAICNPDDITLRYVYTTVGMAPKAAFGANGTPRSLVNVEEYVVPTNITREVRLDSAWGRFQTLKDIANHKELFYLAALKHVLDGDWTDGGVMVPQHFVNVKGRVLDAGMWWDVVEEHLGWKLERNKVTGHFRILTPEKRRAAWGREREMRAAFEKTRNRVGP